MKSSRRTMRERARCRAAAQALSCACRRAGDAYIHQDKQRAQSPKRALEPPEPHQIEQSQFRCFRTLTKSEGFSLERDKTRSSLQPAAARQTTRRTN